MARTNGLKNQTSAEVSPDILDSEDTAAIKDSSEQLEDIQDIDDVLNSLKTLLSTVEKLPKSPTRSGRY